MKANPNRTDCQQSRYGHNPAGVTHKTLLSVPQSLTELLGSHSNPVVSSLARIHFLPCQAELLTFPPVIIDATHSRIEQFGYPFHVVPPLSCGYIARLKLNSRVWCKRRFDLIPCGGIPIQILRIKLI